MGWPWPPVASFLEQHTWNCSNPAAALPSNSSAASARFITPSTGTQSKLTESEWLRSEGTSRGYLVQPPAQAGTLRASCPGPRPDSF